jgi:hypothetical protein
MTPRQLRKPTPSLVTSYVTRFERNTLFAVTDGAISKLFQTFPHNCFIEDVLLKVTALNSLYSTHIYAVYDVADRICELGIDSKLEQKSLDVVDQIASIEIRGKKRRKYSFASKYCSWHVPDAYPIYDRFVEQLIWAYQKSDGFAQVRRADLQDYPRYKETVETFRNHYGLTDFSFKQLDKFLWLYGKEVFRPAVSP